MSSLGERVARERRAHTEDDVLARSHALKRRFCHVAVSPTMRRCEADFERALSGLAGKRVLDLGCGNGEQSLRLLAAGARVDGIDISGNYIRTAAQAARAAGFDESRWSFRVMDAHRLEFGDASFDLAAGRGILHHLDLFVALAELRRVLRPGARAVFIEPLAANPLLRLFRRLTPKARTPDERPLGAADLEAIAREWRVESTYYGVFSAPLAVATSFLLRPWPDNALLRLADAIERKANRPASVRPFNQYVLLNLVRPAGDK